ncbi:NADH-quinone oxidoreductase subunit J [Termitidicoccus mucosus]|uniref:NADH-quinone oxidoreductase subunit J family protein n=1 Tax=Termitidicoccus mucosus TaxID=1184151 RepID=UPI00318363D2
MPDLSLLSFLAIALVTIGASAVAITRRNIIHSALLLVAGWVGIAAYYLWAGAEFVAFAQILVYVGAVSMVVLFAVLLTRLGPGDTAPAPGPSSAPPRSSRRSLLRRAFRGHPHLALQNRRRNACRRPGVRQLGLALMEPANAAALLVIILLTVALIGAIVIASIDRRGADNWEAAS